MIEIDGKIISLDIFNEHFMCDIGRCKGMCCVDGNAGAPLEIEELGDLEQEYEKYKVFMKSEGIEAVEKDGFAVLDPDGDLTTPLIEGMECAYSFDENGATFCAIEKAWKMGLTTFRKPVSCHLYPIRVSKFKNGTFGLNYHRWDVCHSAVECGKKLQVPVYKALKEPLIRMFGEEFYQALHQADAFIKESGY